MSGALQASASGPKASPDRSQGSYSLSDKGQGLRWLQVHPSAGVNENPAPLSRTQTHPHVLTWQRQERITPQPWSQGPGKQRDSSQGPMMALWSPSFALHSPPKPLTNLRASPCPTSWEPLERRLPCPVPASSRNFLAPRRGPVEALTAPRGTKRHSRATVSPAPVPGTGQPPRQAFAPAAGLKGHGPLPVLSQLCPSPQGPALAQRRQAQWCHPCPGTGSGDPSPSPAWGPAQLHMPLPQAVPSCTHTPYTGQGRGSGCAHRPRCNRDGGQARRQLQAPGHHQTNSTPPSLGHEHAHTAPCWPDRAHTPPSHPWLPEG